MQRPSDPRMHRPSPRFHQRRMLSSMFSHEPYQAWCETCVQFCARQNQHASEAAYDPESRSVVSFDFGYCSCLKGDRAREDKDRLTVLLLHDRHAKTVYAVPTAQKGGPGRAGCRLGEHAAVFIHDLEKACSASSDQVLFSPQHPLYGWAECHACWVRNRYTPAHGTASYEAITDSLTLVLCVDSKRRSWAPSSPMARHRRDGVMVCGSVRPQAVTHILGMTGGVFVTRSVRRFSDSFDADLAASFDVCVGSTDCLPLEANWSSVGRTCRNACSGIHRAS